MLFQTSLLGLSNQNKAWRGRSTGSTSVLKTETLIKQPRSRCQRSETPVGAHLQIVAQQIQDFQVTSWLPPVICGDLCFQLNSRPSKSSVVFICCQYPYVRTLARSCQRSLRAVPDLCLLSYVSLDLSFEQHLEC